MGTEANPDDLFGIPPPEVAQQYISEAEAERRRLVEAAKRINSLFFRERGEGIGGGSVTGEPVGGYNLREPIYQGVYRDVFGVQKQKLDENAGIQQRQLGFSLAGRGLTGGSADIDARSTEGRAYSDGLQRASETAQDQSDATRKNDEQTRLNLLSQVRSGLDSDSATQSAYTQMSNNAAVGRSNAGYTAANDYLNDVAPLFVQNAQQQGATAARNGFSSVFGVSRNNNGKVIN